MLYKFEDFELDTNRFELRQDGNVVHIEPLVFDLILFFAQNSQRVIGRDEIVDQVWNGRIVSETTISSCVKSARRALGDSGEEQRLIRTVRGRGSYGLLAACARDAFQGKAGASSLQAIPNRARLTRQ